MFDPTNVSGAASIWLGWNIFFHNCAIEQLLKIFSLQLGFDALVIRRFSTPPLIFHPIVDRLFVVPPLKIYP